MKLFRFTPILAAAFCFSLSLRAELVDSITAVVSSTAVTRAEVWDFVGPADQTLRREYAGQPGVYDQKLGEALNDGLEQLIERQLILHEFEVGGFKLPDSLGDELVQEQIRSVYSDRITMMKSLQAEGKTYEKFRKDVLDQFIIREMRQIKVSPEKIIISPYKIETYYLDHQDDFKIADEVKLRMIVLNKVSNDDTNTVGLANEILAKIKEGATFSEMAVVYSQGSQRSQGGDWGWIERSKLRKELADAALPLKAGQVSDVIETPGTIETPGAYYIMLVEDKHPAHVKPLNEVRDEIEVALRAQSQKQMQQQWITQLKKRTYWRLY